MTRIWPIHGGIHPAENKQQSMQLPLARAAIAPELVLPLNQHLGAPAKAIVSVGQRVLTGQMIAEPDGPFSAAVHASSSGTVSAIEDRPLPHASGMSGPCIVIQTDGKDEWIERQPCADYSQLELSELVARIRNAGIAGMGGAGFPTAIKLSPKANQPIHTLILNGTECEPYITADDRLMRDFPEQVIEGAKLLAHLLHQPERVVIGVEDNKPEAIAALREAAQGSQVEVAVFPTKYPSGGEKQLIQILTGKEVPSGKIPADIGIVVQNVGTAVAAWRAIVKGEPLIERITTVVGKALDTERNVLVRLGTPVAQLLAEHGYREQDASRLIMGGPMMGFTLTNPQVPVVKTTNCLLAPDRTELPPPPPPQPCIRCGLCAEACPASLLPQQLYWYAAADDHEKLQAYNLFDCIECGACAFVCPSSIPLVQYYRAAKGDIRQAQADKIKSDRSRERFAFRQQRLARAEAEKEAKRQARARAAEEAKARMAEQQSAGTAAPDTDPVAAAIARAKAQQQNASQNPQDQREKLERQLSSAKNRVTLCEQKAAEAETEEQAEKFNAALKAAQIKVAECEQKLAALDTESKPANDDPVAAAIARAKAKMAMDPEQKLRAALSSLQQRLATAQQKLARAQAEGDSKAEALQTGVEKLQQKIADTQAELAELERTNQPSPEPAQEDAAAQAIARAQTKAQALASMSEEDKLKQQIQSLTQRLARAKTKLADAEAEGSEHVDALRTGVEKLQSKLEQTQAKLENA